MLTLRDDESPVLESQNSYYQPDPNNPATLPAEHLLMLSHPPAKILTARVESQKEGALCRQFYRDARPNVRGSLDLNLDANYTYESSAGLGTTVYILSDAFRFHVHTVRSVEALLICMTRNGD